jgi:predicted aspartyl protease
VISAIKIVDSLPFVELIIVFRGNSVVLHNVLVDTGSATSILKLELVEKIGINAEPEDCIGSVSGVGGKEFVFIKRIDALEICGFRLSGIDMDIGVMDYGADIDGILGMDVLNRIHAVIDLEGSTISGKHV